MEKTRERKRNKKARKKPEVEMEGDEELGEPSEPSFEPLQVTPEIAEMLTSEANEAPATDECQEAEHVPEASSAPPTELEDSIRVERSPVERPFQELSLNSWEANSLASSTLTPTAPVELYPVLPEQAMAPVEPTAPEAPAEPFLDENLLREIQPMDDAQLSTLYRNLEVVATKDFVAEFFESQKGLQGHPLYELLSSYLRARTKLLSGRMELEQMVEEGKGRQETVWTQGQAVITETGKCSDGVSVTAQHSYPTADMSEEALNSLGRNLSASRTLLNETLSLYAYRAEVLRLQVEQMLQETLILYANVPPSTPVQLLPPRPSATALWAAISVLFLFSRKQTKDQQFLEHCREWLLRLGSTLLRVATAKDHIFLLLHVLTSPPGVTLWATPLVQVPLRNIIESYPSTNSVLLDHAVAILAVLMEPPVQLECRPAAEEPGCWVLLDDEGEEMQSGLAENDLVALLNQVPMDGIFRHVLGVQRRDGAEIYFPESASESSLLRLLAFASSLVLLLGKGLRTYDSTRYRQFAKRLSRLVRHTVQYVSDVWEIFREGASHRGHDPQVLARLQVEYDNLLLRSTQCIFSSQKLGAWQFLAIIPYNVASCQILWQLFYLLHHEYQQELTWTNYKTDWKNEVSQLSAEFESKLNAMPEAEVYFLLNTFSNMAIARGTEDSDFITTVAMDLFRVGFSSKETQEMCSKTCRSLLSNLVDKHPFLMSQILIALKEKMESVGMRSLYLVKELPLKMWYPEDSDMKILSDWLLGNPNTLQSSVARSILASLDWNVLDWQLQFQVAKLTVEACLKHAPEKSGPVSPGSVAEGVSSLAAMVRNQSSPEQSMVAWSWGLVSRLRLHSFDSRARESDIMSQIPELEDVEILAKGVRDKEPLACFVALLATSWGHSVPLLCAKGLPLLATMLSHAKYDAVCEALHFVLPHFMPCVDSLVASKEFLSTFHALITADRGYVKMAKNLIMADSPGPVLKQVANLVQTQFLNFQRYHLESPHALTELWLSILTSLPEWPRDPCIVHLLDIVLRESYVHHYAKEVASNKFRELYKQGISKQGNALSSIISWVSNSGNNSLMGRVACPEAPWMALFIIEVEQEENEIKNGLWKQFLVELADMNKTNLDQAMKKAANALKVAPVPMSNIAIYRWAQQALDTRLDHPLLPIFWQKFFSLYLARVPKADISGPDRGSVGLKFFEGIVNTSYLKRLKRRLADAAELYETRATDPGFTGEGAEEEGGERRVLHGKFATLLRTLVLWIEETRLHDPNIYLAALPPQYEPNRLGRLLAGDTNPWYEFLDMDDLHEKRREALRDWKLQHFRNSDYKLSRKSEDRSTALSRMLSRLQAYDHPVDAPGLRPFKVIVPFLPREELVNPSATLANLERNFQPLLEFAQVHLFKSSELAAIDCTLLELIPNLYRENEVKVSLRKACEPSSRKKNGAKDCTGPFRTIIQVREWRVSSGTKHQVQQNRKEHGVLLARSSEPPPQKVCYSAVFAEHLVHRLISEGLTDTGVAVFYYLVSKYSEEVSFYPPTKQLLSSCLELLGQKFIGSSERECEKLLGTILEAPLLSGLLSPHLSPHLAPTPSFLSMYSKVVGASNVDVAFALLSKFDVQKWLQWSRPRLKERSQFVQSLGQAFVISGREPPEDRLILHETFLRHLRAILHHDFPEHYGEVLNLLLKLSEAQTLSLDVWWTVLDALTPADQPKLRLGNGLKDQLRIYATQQRLLGLNELRETAGLLGSYFMRERMQFGLHGVYPKYRGYAEPLSVFMSMLGHGLVVGTLHQGRGALGDSLSEQLWPVLTELWGPWVLPLSGQRHQTAAWIQQMTDDRTVLLPWTAQDAPAARPIADALVSTIGFLLDTLPASSVSLCYLFQLYAIHFTHPAEHVLAVVHPAFLALPWDRFWPRPVDIDAMIRLSDQYLPHNHTFLGAVFIQVPWVMWVQNQPSERNHQCLMSLLVKLSSEPSVKQNPKVVTLLDECRQQLAWHMVDSSTFDQALNWFVMGSDPRVVLPDHPELHPVDVAVFKLLQQIAGFTPSVKHFHSTTVRKRLAFIRASSKLLVSCSTRFKALISKDPQAFVNAQSSLLDQIEAVIFQTVPPSQQLSECALLLGELLTGTLQSAPLNSILVSGLNGWLAKHTGGSIVVLGLLKTIGISIQNQQTLGLLLEDTLEAFFRDTKVPNTTWARAVSILQPALALQAGQEPLEHLLFKESRLLSLHALLLKQELPEHVLPDLLEWLPAVKACEETEPKLPLLWNLALRLLVRAARVGRNEKTAVFSQHLVAIGEERGWDLLGAIGLRKQQQPTVRLRLLARATNALLLAQLPKCGDQVCPRTGPDSPGALHNLSSSSIGLEVDDVASPTAQTLQAVAALEQLLQTKLSPPELKDLVSEALVTIRDPATSLDNLEERFASLSQKLYTNLVL